MKRLLIGLSIGALLLLGVLALEYYTDWDVLLQEHFFDRANNRWLIYPALHKKLSFIFYSGLKNVLIATAVFCLIRLLYSIKHQNLRAGNQPYLIMLLSIIFVPLIVASAKYFTNVYCPYQLNIYNGLYPFVRILENYPADFTQPKPGRCFPAGHATAGFAFMALYYCFKSQKNRILGLCLGLTLGWSAAIYQMYRGQHFLSHSVFSMISAFMVIMIINYVVKRIYSQRYWLLSKSY